MALAILGAGCAGSGDGTAQSESDSNENPSTVSLADTASESETGNSTEVDFPVEFVNHLEESGADGGVATCYANVLAEHGIDSFEELSDPELTPDPDRDAAIHACADEIAGR